MNIPTTYDPAKKYWWFCRCDTESRIIHDIGANVNLGQPWQSISGHYDSEEELREHTGFQPVCCECGQPFSTTYDVGTKARLIANKTCFHCDHWRGYERKKDAPGSVRINGVQYWANVNHPISEDQAKFRGHGGRDFEIHFADGRVVKTNDLWCAGRISGPFLARLPDNATFEWPAPIRHGQGFLA